MMRRALLALIAALAVGAPTVALVPALPAAAATGGLEVRLLDAPSWVTPADALQVVLEVSNRSDVPVTRLGVQFSFYPPAKGRTDLNKMMAGSRLPGRQAADTVEIDQVIGPGETRAVTASKLIAEVSWLRSEDNHVYPARITVGAGPLSAPPITFPLVYFNQPAALPLQLALVIPLHIPAIYDEDGHVVRSRLREQVDGGRISRILDGIQSYPDVPVTIAPTAILLDTLSDLADGFVAASRAGPVAVAASDPSATAAATLLSRMQALAARPQTRLVVLPYSGARLPRLVAANLTDRAQAQVARARARLKEVLGLDPLPGWVLPTGGELDDSTLEALTLSGLTQTIVAPSSLRPRTITALTPNPAVKIATRGGESVPALVEDAGLGARLVAGPGQTPAQTRQRFLAEAAALMLEQPGRKRAAVAVAPLDWAPADSTVGGILDALARSPWMRGATPDAILGNPELPQAVGARTVASAGPPRSTGVLEPPADYFAALRDARRMIDEYADIGPPPDRLARIQTNLLIAESADWWTGKPAIERGTRYARAVRRIIRGEFGKIRAPESQSITLTAHEGVIPILVRSDADYPVDVMIRLESDKLGFPDGMRLRRQLIPRGQSIEVRAIAKTTGSFPVRVVLETPGRGVVLGSSRLVVRSTAYNVVGLGITGGAAFFLLTWWMGSIIRRRTARGEAGEAGEVGRAEVPA